MVQNIAEFLKNNDLKNKNVLYRIDGNVDIINGNIHNDFRLRAILPTLKLLTDADAQITIATHIGRPKGVKKEFSTAPLKAWFTEHGFPEINLLENLRFHDGEKTKNPEKALAFARELANGIDYYINDAWGLLHRNDTSITVLPLLFEQKKRSFGLLIENELAALETLKNDPQTPYVIILGGGKVETKLPMIERLIKKKINSKSSISTLIILPALSFTFMRAMGLPTGASLVDETLIPQAASIMKLAQKNNIELIFPNDYTYLFENKNLGICEAMNIPDNAVGMGVGPRSLQLLEPTLYNARTIFFNGAMGNQDQPETMKSLDALLYMISESPAYSVVGGGNSVAEVETCGLINSINYCSTGGGSTLMYISDGPMPGLDAMRSPTYISR